jgi:ADP-heptose:LPS heptosyltransferase
VTRAANATGTVALVPAGKYPVQHWASENFKQLAAALRAAGVAITWLGGPEDVERAIECGAEPGDANLVGKLDIKACTEAMARCRAVVCNDTGLAHLAASVGVPVVVVTSSRNAAGAWTPVGDSSRIRVLRSDVACESCQLQQCASLICLKLIEPEHVMHALAQMGVVTRPGAEPQS